MNGIRIRFETKPGRSRASAGVLPRSTASALIAAAVSSEVSSPRITSTSFRTGTGLKKCMPITCAGRDVAAASDVIGIDDVFEARIAFAGSVASARRKISSFTAASSTTASIISSAGTMSSAGSIRASTSSGSPPPFSARRASDLRIVSRPRSTAPGAASCSETRRPDAATTCAMPPPICPAPTTRTCSNATRGGYRRAIAHVHVNGARLWVEDEGNGPVVLFLHGGLGDNQLWEPQAHALADQFRCVRFDLRHFGRSEAPGGEFSFVDDAVGLMDELAIERAAVVGLSMGGGAALDLAAAHPDRLWALVHVAGGVTGMPVNAYTEEARGDTGARLRPPPDVVLEDVRVPTLVITA